MSQTSSHPETTSWSEHITGINSLGESILASGWKPTAILAIARGGLIPATILAYMLDVRRIIAIDVQHYDANRSRFEGGTAICGRKLTFTCVGRGNRQAANC